MGKGGEGGRKEADGGLQAADCTTAERHSGTAAQRHIQIIKAAHGLHGWDGSERVNRGP